MEEIVKRKKVLLQNCHLENRVLLVNKEDARRPLFYIGAPG
jgi:hypothetical protein